MVHENIFCENEYKSSFEKKSKRERKCPFTMISLLVSLVIFTSFFDITSSAPAAPYSKFKSPREKGCYYLLKHYENGQEIETNEPCLNCTCLNSMLMCYLRVCPYVRPIGDRCIIERVPGECCPRITCPDSSVDGTSSETEQGDDLGCYIDGEHYKEGAQIPSDPSKPCEVCYCIRNTSSCVVQECTLKVSGCQPIFSSDSCCPTRYNCSEEAATTVPPGLLHPSSPQLGCRANGKNFLDGEAVPSRDACEHCYCMKNEIVCAVQECKAPCDGCVSIPSDNDQCCPERYECAAPTRITNGTSLLEAVTTTSESPTSVKESVSSVTPNELHAKIETTSNEPEVTTKAPIAESRVVLIPSQPRRDEPGQSRRRPFPSVGVIPGEGICRHEGRVYQNGDEVLSRNPCVEYCMCINSVVYCDETVCTEPKIRDGNCTRVKLPTDCCPRYECHTLTTTTTTTTEPTTTTTTTTTTEPTTTITSTTTTEPSTTTTLTSEISTTISEPTTVKSEVISFTTPTSVTSMLSTLASAILDFTTLAPKVSDDLGVSEESVDLSPAEQPTTEAEIITDSELGTEIALPSTASPVANEEVPSENTITTSNPIVKSSTSSTTNLGESEVINMVEDVTMKPISSVISMDNENVVPTTENIESIERDVTTTSSISSTTVEPIKDDTILEEVSSVERVDVPLETVPLTTNKVASIPTTTASSQQDFTTLEPEVSDDLGVSEESVDPSPTERSTSESEKTTLVKEVTLPPTTSPVAFEEISSENAITTSIPITKSSPSSANEIEETINLEEADVTVKPVPSVVSMNDENVVPTTENFVSAEREATTIAPVPSTTSESRKDQPISEEVATDSWVEISSDPETKIEDQKTTNAPPMSMVISSTESEITTLGNEIALPSTASPVAIEDISSENTITTSIPIVKSSPTSVTEFGESETVNEDDVDVTMRPISSVISMDVENVVPTTVSDVSLEREATTTSPTLSSTSEMEKDETLPEEVSTDSRVEVFSEPVTKIEEQTTTTTIMPPMSLVMSSTEPSGLMSSTEASVENEVTTRVERERSVTTSSSISVPTEAIFEIKKDETLLEEVSTDSRVEVSSEKESKVEEQTTTMVPPMSLVMSSTESPALISSSKVPLEIEATTKDEQQGLVTTSSPTPVSMEAIFETKKDETISEEVTTESHVEISSEMEKKIEEPTTTTIVPPMSLIMSSTQPTILITSSEASTELAILITSTEPSTEPIVPISSTETPVENETTTREEQERLVTSSSSAPVPTESIYEQTTMATPVSLNISSNGTVDYLLKEVTSSPMVTTMRPIGNEQLADSESNKILDDDDGSCVFEGKVFQSAEQIPRPHPCDFCFCFRGDIICLQQTCPPPIPRCYETPIQGFCCPRYECPVSSTSPSNATTPRSVESPKGCQVNGTFYEIGERVQQASGPCLECKCDHSGLMQCDPQTCSPPAPLLLRMNRDFFASTIRR